MHTATPSSEQKNWRSSIRSVGFNGSRRNEIVGHELDHKTAKQVPKGDDWTPIVSGGSEEVLG
jgi:hypothetical protein